METFEGRTREVDWLAERLDGLRAGRSFAALVRGEPGVGKSTLIATALAAHAGGLRVLRARGFESDSEIPFAGLLELATPLLDLRAELPATQRAALESAFALEPPTAHDRFAVPAGLLGLLAGARRRAPATPLLLVVDDVHWLDDASREALLFVARRPTVDGVGMLLAARPGASGRELFDGIEQLTLEGLDGVAARALLTQAAPQLAAPVADALVTATAGNPLALIELPAVLTPAQRTGDEPLADPLPAGAAVTRAFATQVAALAPASRRALLLAAVLQRDRLDVLGAALRHVGLAPDALAPAERAQLVTVAHGDVNFRHPLLRAAVHATATSDERRAAHAALGAVASDPRLRAWHLAHAAATADEEVASALEAAARDARARSGHAEAARAFARAAQLSTDPAARGRRALEAAQDHAVAGHVGAALAQLELAAPLVEPGLLPAVARLRGNLAMRRGEPAAAQRILEQAADAALATRQHAVAAALLLESSISYTMTGDPAGMRSVLERASAAAAVAGGPAELVARTMVAVQQTVEGETAVAAAALRALAPQVAEIDLLGQGEPVGLLALALLWCGDDDGCGQVVQRLVGSLREQEAIGSLPFPLSVRALLRERRGDWGDALADAEEAVRLARAIGQTAILSYCLAALARIEGATGRDDDAVAHAREGLALAAAGHAVYSVHLLAALGRAALAAGRLEEAAEVLADADARSAALGWHEPRITLLAGDRIEALVRLGRAGEASALLDRLAADAELTDGAWTHAVVARGRLLLAEPEEVDVWAAQALERHARDGMPFERARSELAHGERLRRLRRRADARGPLMRAHAAFVALGAVPWMQRAQEELVAAGGAVRGAEGGPDGQGRRRAAGAGGRAGAGGPGGSDAPGGGSGGPSPARAALTPHELRVAQLVGHGLTNREVAATLFLSPKTIERHLSRIYRVLDVRSRTELARLLAEDG